MRHLLRSPKRLVSPRGFSKAASQPSTLAMEMLACQETVTMNCWPRAGDRQYARYTPT